MAKATENKVIEIKPIKMNRVEVTLVGDKELLKMLQQMVNDIKDIRNNVVKEQGEPQISKRADYLAEMERREHGREKDVQ